MAEEKSKEQPSVSNEISDETGELDVRFLLWRQFCDENSVPVETLPSELSGEAKEKWEKMKENSLHKPTENR